MYVKEITLEGFKSYAQRTVVSGFDPQFNAITGLNGSGKSNILDSICFVLGITNLQQVRASNLQELVYKQGQAGITKATVSIVFDNSDRKRSPIGYEDMNEITVTRQIVIGGRNKYQINGHVAQPTVVQNLYHSVQLNINNPHFLIMQGRITKVLNMKPPEILAMLEEAAGTKMYESKKEVALKTLEKKQTKVDQIDSLLSQDILPALEKLRRERAQYQQWTAGNAQVDRLERFCLAYEFSEAERVKEAASGEASLLLAKVDSLKSATARIQEDIVQNEASVASLTHAKEKQMNREMKSFSDRVDKLSIALVKIDSAFNAKEESFGADKAAVEQLQRNAKDLACVIATETAAERQAEEGFLELKQKVEQQGKKLEDLERDYQGIQAGKGSGADEKSLADQRDDANAAVGKTAIEVEQSRTKIKHLDKELNEKQQHFKSKQHEVVAAREELQTRTAELKKLQDAIDNTGFEEGRMDFLEQSQRTETETVRRLKTEVSNLMGDLSGLQFSYNDPERGFDRSRVKGPVARLLRVKDASTMTALEVIAGSKLYNIVVDTEQTAKLLLEKGGLRQRVTFIPLNKIQCNPIPSRTQTAAAKLVGPTMARPALSLVDYDNELERAMAFVFGGAFVCNDIVTAKKVAFHKDINTKSVTLQGDVFEPHGLLTGGSRRNGGERLMKLRALEEAEGSLAEHVQALSKIEKEIASLAPIQKKYAHLKSQLELKSYDLSLYQTRAEQSEHHKLSEVISTMATELEAEQKDLANKEIRHKQLIKKVSDLDRAINEHDRDRDTRLKDVERSIASTKKEMAAASKDLKEKEGARERLLMEREVAVREKLDIEKQVVTALAQLKKMEAEVAQLSNERESMKKEYLNAQAELNKERDRIKDCDAEISRMIKHQNQLKTKHTDNVVEIKKLENEIKRMDAEQKECAERVEKLLKNHPWIAREKPMFGKPGTDYDFSTQDARGARELLETKLAEQKNTEKRINKKALAMFDKAEEEYKDLIERKRIVQNDKAKIQQVIKELDEKRKDQLRKTWMTVTKGFGSIFSTLLPGTTSELQPPEDADFMDGLEVRVAFGGVWKKSLSELSGGQRSLLALSLILALLLFKPAPLYILDEVDAALDLSHTQNIGRMIKSHFPQSQFIIVSLKEGMFNNANVLFRTKFVDGLSTVTRTVHRK